jgi:hypothetical protein
MCLEKFEIESLEENSIHVEITGFNMSSEWKTTIPHPQKNSEIMK